MNFQVFPCPVDYVVAVAVDKSAMKQWPGRFECRLRLLLMMARDRSVFPFTLKAIARLLVSPDNNNKKKKNISLRAETTPHGSCQRFVDVFSEKQ